MEHVVHIVADTTRCFFCGRSLNRNHDLRRRPSTSIRSYELSDQFITTHPQVLHYAQHVFDRYQIKSTNRLCRPCLQRASRFSTNLEVEQFRKQNAIQTLYIPGSSGVLSGDPSRQSSSLQLQGGSGRGELSAADRLKPKLQEQESLPPDTTDNIQDDRDETDLNVDNEKLNLPKKADKLKEQSQNLNKTFEDFGSTVNDLLESLPIKSAVHLHNLLDTVIEKFCSILPFPNDKCNLKVFIKFGKRGRKSKVESIDLGRKVTDHLKSLTPKSAVRLHKLLDMVIEKFCSMPANPNDNHNLVVIIKYGKTKNKTLDKESCIQAKVASSTQNTQTVEQATMSLSPEIGSEPIEFNEDNKNQAATPTPQEKKDNRADTSFGINPGGQKVTVVNTTSKKTQKRPFNEDPTPNRADSDKQSKRQKLPLFEDTSTEIAEPEKQASLEQIHIQFEVDVEIDYDSDQNNCDPLNIRLCS